MKTWNICEKVKAELNSTCHTQAWLLLELLNKEVTQKEGVWQRETL